MKFPIKQHENICRRPPRYQPQPPTISVCHKPDKSLPWAMGVHSISRILQHHTTSLPYLQHIITTNPKPPTEPSIQIAYEFMSRQVSLHYTYRLTRSHIGDFRDVPLIEVSVEARSPIKHCRKKRRSITFTVDAQEKKAKGRTLIKILLTAQRRQTFFKLQTSRHQPKTQRPINHRVHSISRLRQHPPLRRHVLTPHHQTEKSAAKKHEISSRNFS
jgi:hypothetical protein